MFKPGDKYIHFTKYGGVNRGVVKYYSETQVMDTKNRVIYLRSVIHTTTGVGYDTDKDGTFYKIQQELTDKQIEAIDLWINHAKDGNDGIMHMV